MGRLPIQGTEELEAIDAVLLLVMALNQLEQGQFLARRACAGIASDPRLAGQLDPSLLRLLVQAHTLTLTESERSDPAPDGPDPGA